MSHINWNFTEMIVFLLSRSYESKMKGMHYSWRPLTRMALDKQRWRNLVAARPKTPQLVMAVDDEDDSDGDDEGDEDDDGDGDGDDEGDEDDDDGDADGDDDDDDDEGDEGDYDGDGDGLLVS